MSKRVQESNLKEGSAVAKPKLVNLSLSSMRKILSEDVSPACSWKQSAWATYDSPTKYSQEKQQNDAQTSNTRKQGRRDESGQPPAGKSLCKGEVHPFGRRKLEFPKMQISENQGILVGGGRVAKHEGRNRGGCCQRAEGCQRSVGDGKKMYLAMEDGGGRRTQDVHSTRCLEETGTLFAGKKDSWASQSRSGRRQTQRSGRRGEDPKPSARSFRNNTLRVTERQPKPTKTSMLPGATLHGR